MVSSQASLNKQREAQVTDRMTPWRCETHSGPPLPSYLPENTENDWLASDRTRWLFISVHEWQTCLISHPLLFFPGLTFSCDSLTPDLIVLNTKPCLYARYNASCPMSISGIIPLPVEVNWPSLKWESEWLSRWQCLISSGVFQKQQRNA